ncbi:MAG: hypothetical protein JW881_07790 [Spirochaetales bacterium]|nr:hypothetical protein [Spirochaetales bacterium]
MKAFGFICLILIISVFYSCYFESGTAAEALLLVGHTECDLSTIADAEIAKARRVLHIAYQHTSHGSQLVTGMRCLAAYPDFKDRYRFSEFHDSSSLHLYDYGIPGCADLSQGDSEDENGDTPWVAATRGLLDDPSNSHINVIVWSWCSISGHNAERYVVNMEKLIAGYPGVVFVFMTGHAQGQSENMTPDSVHYNNEYIRNHCLANNRVLYDFADIEAYDPDGDYFWDRAMYDNLYYNGGNWAVEWIAENPDSELARLAVGNGVEGYGGCSGCAHSDTPPEANLNCILKAQAAWLLWVSIAKRYF